MSEQLYRIRKRDIGGMGVYDKGLFVGCLVPVPEVHDLRWAWEKMRGGEHMWFSGKRYRVNRDGVLQVCIINDRWCDSTFQIDMLDGPWFETIPEASPQPGTLDTIESKLDLAVELAKQDSARIDLLGKQMADVFQPSISSRPCLSLQVGQLTDRIDILGRQIEVHDNLMADLAARLAKLERTENER